MTSLQTPWLLHPCVSVLTTDTYYPDAGVLFEGNYRVYQQISCSVPLSILFLHFALVSQNSECLHRGMAFNICFKLSAKFRSSELREEDEHQMFFGLVL